VQRKKIQLNLRRVPKDIDIYIFGSYINSEKPNDVDLIIIYDSNIYAKNSIYDYCSNIINQIKEKSRLPIDVTFLSIKEEIEIQFVEFVEAISINDIFYISREE